MAERRISRRQPSNFTTQFRQYEIKNLLQNADYIAMKRSLLSSLFTLSIALPLFSTISEERSFIVRCVDGNCIDAYFREDDQKTNISYFREATKDEVNLLNVSFKFIKSSGIASGIFRYTITKNCQKLFYDSLQQDPSGKSLSWEWVQRPFEPRTPHKGKSALKSDKECLDIHRKNSSEPITDLIGENKEKKVHCAFDVERISDRDSYVEYLSTYYSAVTPGLKKLLL